MKILLIDTGCEEAEVTLFDGKRVVRKSLFKSNEDLSFLLFQNIQKVLKKEKAEGILCVKGPGHFTSARIGVVAAMGLALGFNIPVIGVLREEKESGFERILKRESDNFFEPKYTQDPGITGNR
jgi:tRNA A37 threonylcarbamoyladenosine modification protein TsaB